MPLTEAQIASLHDAIGGYAFPPVYYDFEEGNEKRQKIGGLQACWEAILDQVGSKI